jgi:hypothetical protein
MPKDQLTAQEILDRFRIGDEFWPNFVSTVLQDIPTDPSQGRPEGSHYADIPIKGPGLQPVLPLA